MIDARRKRIIGCSIVAMLASLIIAVACILFVALGGMALFLTAVEAVPYEEKLLRPLTDAEED